MADLSRSQKRQLVEALQTDYSVRQICDTLGFNRSSLYYQPKADPFEQRLRDEIEKLAACHPTYGYRRITQLLLRMGYAVGYRRVARLMKEANLLVTVKRACQTTQSLHSFGQWVNRVENLDICRRVWVGDITYVRLKGQFVYVSVLAHVKRKCKTRIEIVGAGSPRPQSVRVGGPNPYEDSVAVARFLNMNLSVNGCIHPNDKRVATESILDTTAHIETPATRIKPKRSRFTIATKAFSIFQQLIFLRSSVMGLRFR